MVKDAAEDALGILLVLLGMNLRRGREKVRKVVILLILEAFRKDGEVGGKSYYTIIIITIFFCV